MKIDFKKVITQRNGNPLKDGNSDDDYTVRHSCCDAIEFIEPGGRLGRDEKNRRLKWSDEVWNADEDYELEEEVVELILRVSGEHFPVRVYGALSEALGKKED